MRAQVHQGWWKSNAQSAADLNEALKNAIKSGNQGCDTPPIGIMVTRTGAGRYIVRAHPEVPYGLIRQRHIGARSDEP
jgi:hypothetical protein